MDKLGKNIKRATALMVAISMGGGVAFVLHSKYGKTKTSDTVVNNVGKISNPQASTSNNDLWTGNYIYFGHYPQSSDGNDGYNNDPIRWRVLDNDNVKWDSTKSISENGFVYNVGIDIGGRQNAPIGDNGILLSAEKFLDYIRYNETVANLDSSLKWSECSLRSWLNNTNSFYSENNFSSCEKASICTTKIYTEDAKENRNGVSDYASSARTSTSEEKIFILSYNEALNNEYGFSVANRIMPRTDYSEPRITYRQGRNSYWTRTPGINTDNNGRARIVSFDNGMYIPGGDATDLYRAVVPAMNLDISKILFVSKADDSNKPSEVSSVPTAFGMPTGYGNEYKLTVKDTSRNFAIGDVTQTGKVAEISYSGAQTGNNEYISCIIANANDASDIKYYGRLDNAKTSGKVKIRIPDESSGYVIKLFNERCNGANETDWASETQNLTIDSEGKVTTENYDVSNYAEVESIEIEPKSHSISGGGPAENTTVILHGKNFSSNYKATIEFRVDGEENPVLSYPATFSDASDTTLTIRIPKSEIEKLNDNIGKYTVEAKVETN